MLILTVPLYMLQVFDRVLTSRSIDTLLSLTLIAGIALTCLAILDASRSALISRLGHNLEERTAGVVLGSSIKAALATARTPSVQGLRDLGQIRSFLNSGAATALLDMPWYPLFLAVIFLLHPLLGWLTLGGSVVLLGLAVLAEAGSRKRSEKIAVAQQELLQDAECGVRNADAFDAMGISSNWIERWLARNRDMLFLAGQASDNSSRVLSLSRLFRMGLQVGVLGVGASLILVGELTPGAMIAASILTSRALAPIEQSIGAWRTVLATRRSYQQVRNTLEASTETATLPLPKPVGDLHCENVTYFHPGEQEPCIKSIEFSAAAGEVIGIVGPSGAGKSTLARLLVGTLKPRLGQVRLDGRDISRWSSADRGKYVGYLPQDVELMSGSVLDNICRFTEPDKDRVIAAAQLARVHELIMRLPDGYETDIGSRGAALSAGQRQRVAMARALYGDVSLLVLDEPNAHLDREGEDALVDTLKDLRARKVTTIIIAHRPAVLRNVDKVIALGDGRLLKIVGPEALLDSQESSQSPGETGQ